MRRRTGRHRASRLRRGPLADPGRLIGRTKGGMNSKSHLLADAKGRPIRMSLSAGQISDYISARAHLSSIPQVGALLADRGYDADWFCNTLIDIGISPCVPFRIGRMAELCVVSQVASEIRRDGCVADEAHKGHRGRESAPESDLFTPQHEGWSAQGSTGKLRCGHIKGARWPRR